MYFAVKFFAELLSDRVPEINSALLVFLKKIDKQLATLRFCEFYLRTDETCKRVFLKVMLLLWYVSISAEKNNSAYWWAGFPKYLYFIFETYIYFYSIEITFFQLQMHLMNTYDFNEKKNLHKNKLNNFLKVFNWISNLSYQTCYTSFDKYSW